MQILNNLKDEELKQTLVVEMAKARNELKCAQEDIKKANSRLGFLVALTNELNNRSKGKQI